MPIFSFFLGFPLHLCRHTWYPTGLCSSVHFSSITLLQTGWFLLFYLLFILTFQIDSWVPLVNFSFLLLYISRIAPFKITYHFIEIPLSHIIMFSFNSLQHGFLQLFGHIILATWKSLYAKSNKWSTWGSF